MNGGRFPVAVMGASGYVGQHFVRILAAHPQFEIAALGGGPRSEGRPLQELWQLAEPTPTDFAKSRMTAVTPARLEREGIRMAFSAIPSGTAGPFESECRRRGIHVFTNAADHRMDPDVPLLIPEVNPHHLPSPSSRGRRRPLLVANPNCSTTGLVLSIAPLLRCLRPRTIHVTTYQSLSGAGFPGVASLSITDNVIPFISEEEEKLSRESAKILRQGHPDDRQDPQPNIWAQCARVGVREGHLEAVAVEAASFPEKRVIVDALRRFDPLQGVRLHSAPHPPIELRVEIDRPQPLRDRWAGAPPSARGMAAVVGRIRWEPPVLRFFVLSHNAVRGGAGGSVLNAELAAARGWSESFGREL